MGNFNLYPGGAPIPTESLNFIVIEASDPTIMQQRVQAVLDAIGAGGPGSIPGGLLEMALTGAGDGHAFVTTILVDSALPDTPVLADFLTYMASSEPELPIAATAALSVYVPGESVIAGHALAGSAEGRRWMGAFFVVPAIG